MLQIIKKLFKSKDILVVSSRSFTKEEVDELAKVLEIPVISTSNIEDVRRV